MSTQKDQEQVTPPSKEQVLKFYKEQIEVAKLRRDLAQLVAETAEFDARRVEANAKVAYFSNPQGPQNKPNNSETEGVKTAEHIVTQEDLDANPDLINQGVKVGDVVTVQQA
jgi:FKBP-type peptidyl-prolyl cis-trans isomerase